MKGLSPGAPGASDGPVGNQAPTPGRSPRATPPARGRPPLPLVSVLRYRGNGPYHPPPGKGGSSLTVTPSPPPARWGTGSRPAVCPRPRVCLLSPHPAVGLPGGRRPLLPPRRRGVVHPKMGGGKEGMGCTILPQGGGAASWSFLPTTCKEVGQLSWHRSSPPCVCLLCPSSRCGAARGEATSILSPPPGGWSGTFRGGRRCRQPRAPGIPGPWLQQRPAPAAPCTARSGPR